MKYGWKATATTLPDRDEDSIPGIFLRYVLAMYLCSGTINPVLMYLPFHSKMESTSRLESSTNLFLDHSIFRGCSGCDCTVLVGTAQ